MNDLEDVLNDDQTGLSTENKTATNNRFSTQINKKKLDDDVMDQLLVADSSPKLLGGTNNEQRLTVSSNSRTMKTLSYTTKYPYDLKLKCIHLVVINFLEFLKMLYIGA